ncbi:MAG: AMP-binding protein [bacterium]|nr:AMP-binding protein [bacterium]
MKKENDSFVVDTSKYDSIYNLLYDCIQKYGDMPAITDNYNKINLSYNELKTQIDYFASGLQSLGVKKGDYVGVFSENHGLWPIIDFGVLACGAVNVVRGSNAPIEELCYITVHADCRYVIMRDAKLLSDLKPHLKDLDYKFIVLMYGSSKGLEDIKTPVYSYDDIISRGKDHKFIPQNTDLNDEFTILYTSGTTGKPKGVVLTNRNYLYQIKYAHNAMRCKCGEKTLEILPIWHAYERIATYYFLSRGCHMYYTTIAGFKNDLAKYDIDIMMSVPRIWEAIREGIYKKMKQTSPFIYNIFDYAVKISIAYKTHKMYGERRITNKMSYHALSTCFHRIIRTFLKPIHFLSMHTIYKMVKKSAGLNFRVTISGGGALSMRDELFYDAIGIDVRIGYGLTETSPVITLRHVGDKNFLGSVGKPFGEMEIKVVNPQTNESCTPFKQGLVMTRGPQVMKGYLKDKKATDAVIDKNGWFNTGDLGWLTKDNNLVLVGRLKETIVLSSGENVEPQPIEEACLMSPYIEQIVLVGQDKSGIGALIVPSKEALEKCGIEMKNTVNYKDTEIDDSVLHELIRNEINQNIEKKPHLKPFEKIKQFVMLSTGFSVDNGLLSATAKIKRNKVFEKYSEAIEKMYTK